MKIRFLASKKVLFHKGKIRLINFRQRMSVVSRVVVIPNIFYERDITIFCAELTEWFFKEIKVVKKYFIVPAPERLLINKNSLQERFSADHNLFCKHRTFTAKLALFY